MCMIVKNHFYTSAEHNYYTKPHSCVLVNVTYSIDLVPIFVVQFQRSALFPGSNETGEGGYLPLAVFTALSRLTRLSR